MMAPERPGLGVAVASPLPPPPLTPAPAAGAGPGAAGVGGPRGGGATAATAAASPSAAPSAPAPAPASPPPPLCPRAMGPAAAGIKEGDAAGMAAAAALAGLASTPGAGRLGAAASGGGAAGTGSHDDDDLTSLTWLQDRNLLKGMKLTPPMGEAQESPTSDFCDEEEDDEDGDDDCEDLASARSGGRARARGRTGPRVRATARATARAAGSGSDSGSSASASPAPVPLASAPAPAPTYAHVHVSPPGRNKHPINVPYDPLVHVNSKPPYSFSCLIFMAIEDSAQRALPVKEIYLWILEHFPYFKNAPTGWKNSVRHNLSLNKCFRKVEKSPNLGKGSLWMVDPVFRPNLLQALQKAPFHPQSNLERIAAITNSPLNGFPAAAPSLPETPPVSRSAAGRPAGRRLPDPELFPFLSRRLAASGVDIVPVAEEASCGGGGGGGGGAVPPPMSDVADSLDDVDAAAAMLALKHGPLMLISRNDVFRPIQGQNGVDSKFKKKNRASKNPDGTEAMFPVITTSPSEDHTYSAGPTVPLPPAPSSSPDEAYGEGSASEDSSLHSYRPPPKLYVGDSPMVFRCPTRSAVDAEEQRKIAEGADALLNLAGIATRKRTHSGDFHIPAPAVPSPSSSTSSAASSPSRPAPDEDDDMEREEDEEEEVEAAGKAAVSLPKRTIATRGRKRGGLVHSNGVAARHKLSTWAPPGGARSRVGKRRGMVDGRRGGRRRGSHNNAHAKSSKIGATASFGVRSDYESKRQIRSEEKPNRSRR